MKKIFTYVVALITLCTSCTKKECYKTYLFKYPVSIYPDKDTFNIGDTIWVEMNVDNIITDETTEDEVNISNLELEFIMVNSRYDIEYYNNSASDFDFKLIDGNLNLSTTKGLISFDRNDSKKFKLGMIPKVSGGQVITINPRLNNNDDDTIELGSRCIEIISRDSYVEINNNIGNNVEILEDFYMIVDADTLSWITEGYEVEEITSVYVFYVR